LSETQFALNRLVHETIARALTSATAATHAAWRFSFVRFTGDPESGADAYVSSNGEDHHAKLEERGNSGGNSRDNFDPAFVRTK
jgi:hypothetical protein